MSPTEAKKLKPGDLVIVKGTVRSVWAEGKWVDVEFVDYSLNLQSSVVERRKP